MITCVDSCCLINIINGNVVNLIAKSRLRALQYQGLVEDETISHSTALREMTEAGFIECLPGSLFYASEVGQIADKYNIGLGEAECIAIAIKTGCCVASDDRKARLAATNEIGKDRVIGSLGLIKELVKNRLLASAQAYDAYKTIKSCGAHLPNINTDFFK